MSEADGLQAEVEDLSRRADQAEREAERLRALIASRREACAEVEAETERLLSRLVIVAEQAGNGPLADLSRRELSALRRRT